MQQAIQFATTNTRSYHLSRRDKTPVELRRDEKSRPTETTATGEVMFGYPLAATDLTREPHRWREPSREDKLYAELISYLDLPEGWDGYEGVPASFETVDNAFEFLKKRPKDIPHPYPQIAPDGEVGLYWRTEEVYVELSFYGDGQFSYYARYAPAGGEPVEYGRDDCDLGADEWPENLLLVVNKIER